MTTVPVAVCLTVVRGSDGSQMLLHRITGEYVHISGTLHFDDSGDAYVCDDTGHSTWATDILMQSAFVDVATDSIYMFDARSGSVSWVATAEKEVHRCCLNLPLVGRLSHRGEVF